MLKAMGMKRGKSPGYGTLQRTVSQLDVESFEAALSEWAQGVREQEPCGCGLDKRWRLGSARRALPRYGELGRVQVCLGCTLDDGNHLTDGYEIVSVSVHSLQGPARDAFHIPSGFVGLDFKKRFAHFDRCSDRHEPPHDLHFT